MIFNKLENSPTYKLDTCHKKCRNLIFQTQVPTPGKCSATKPRSQCLLSLLFQIAAPKVVQGGHEFAIPLSAS